VLAVSDYPHRRQGDDNASVVKARVTDKAGNVGPDYVVWTGKVDAIPLSPEVNAVSDDFLNLEESEAVGGWKVTGQGVVGGRVVVTLQGTKKDANGDFVTRLCPNEIPVVVDTSDNTPR